MNDGDARLKLWNSEDGSRVNSLILRVRVAELHKIQWPPTVKVVDHILNVLNLRTRFTREIMKDMGYLVIFWKRGARGFINNAAR